MKNKRLLTSQQSAKLHFQVESTGIYLLASVALGMLALLIGSVLYDM
jgi:hypothetical protein